MGRLAKRAAILVLPLTLAACFGSDGDRPSLMEGGQPGGPQPFPDNFRTDALALMRAYLNNPVGVRDAVVAEPVQRTVGGRLRYLTCLRFSPRDSDGSDHDARERAVVYVDGRLDHMVEKAGDLCAGAAYAAFPELEKLTR